MPTKARYTDYHGTMRDSVEHFHGQQIVNVSWDRHLMFGAPACLPVDPEMRFGDLVEQVLSGIFGSHPDFERVDWKAASWEKSGEAFAPDFDASLQANGVVHKDSIRFATPGLDGIAGS